MCPAARHSTSDICDAAADGLAGAAVGAADVAAGEAGGIDAEIAGAGAFDAGAGPHEASTTAVITGTMARRFEMIIGKLPGPS
jgi:hypothetical protein